MSETARDLLRHTVATVAYRGAKALRGAPADFAGFAPSPSSRTAGQILAHIGDLFEWALSMVEGETMWHDSTPREWQEEVARFHQVLSAFDGYLAAGLPLHEPADRLFQGPVADALAHVGQLALMRRLAGAAVRGENYSKAEIAAGRLGPDQAAPRREFD